MPRCTIKRRCPTTPEDFEKTIDALGDGLVVTGRAKDGVVEVIELEDRECYVLGAQFELQEEWRVDPRFLEIFHRFVASTRPQR